MKQVLRNKDKGNFIVRYYKSFLHALDGFKYALFNEHNVIIILIAIIITTIFGFYYKINSYEWLFCIISYALVLATELINTAIEALVDLITIKENPLAKIAKDSMSSATLIFSLFALIGGLIIFIPKIF